MTTRISADGPASTDPVTSRCKSVAMRTSDPAASWVLAAPCVVSRAACATAVMFWAISELPWAASAMLRAISLVVAVCSSTAQAMVLWKSLIW